MQDLLHTNNPNRQNEESLLSPPRPRAQSKDSSASKKSKPVSKATKRRSKLDDALEVRPSKLESETIDDARDDSSDSALSQKCKQDDVSELQKPDIKSKAKTRPLRKIHTKVFPRPSRQWPERASLHCSSLPVLKSFDVATKPSRASIYKQMIVGLSRLPLDFFIIPRNRVIGVTSNSTTAHRVVAVEVIYLDIDLAFLVFSHS